MDRMAGRRAALIWTTNISAAILVLLWIIPTAGLLVSSFRHADQISVSGWWTALTTTERNEVGRSAPPAEQTRDGDLWIVEGNVFGSAEGVVTAFGWRAREPAAFAPGETVEMRDGMTLTVQANGAYRLTSPTEMSGRRGRRIFYTEQQPPSFTRENYEEVVFSEGLGRSFLNTFAVTIPATIIPILIAAYAAYALAWMQFPGRALLLATIVGLLVVPLQMSLIPLLRLYTDIGIGKSYLGIWLAHTGFGLPLAIYLLRNYMAGLPRDIIESAKVDGATDFDVFRRIVLPLSFPALASFAIFQFLWVWNDLLVATVFLGNNEEQLVLTGRLRELLGSRGGNWEILTAAAFVSILVPLCVFFALQRYLVRGLLAGSVK